MKMFLTILFLFFSISLFAQNSFPIPQSIGNASSMVLAQGGLGTKSGFQFTQNFTDTSSANSFVPPNGTSIKNINGFLIRVSDTLWIRSENLSKWIKIGSGSTGTQTFQQTLTAGSILTGNNSIDAGNFNFNITNISNSAFTATDGVSANYLAIHKATAQVNMISQDAAGSTGPTAITSTKWNSGNPFSEVATLTTNVSNVGNFFRVYKDSTVFTLPTGDSIRFHSTLSGTSSGYVWTLQNPNTGSGFWSSPGSSSIAVGATPVIGGGLNGYLYDNIGTLGEGTWGFGFGGTAGARIVDTTVLLQRYTYLGDWFSFSAPNSTPSGWTTFGGYSPTFSAGAILPANTGTYASKFFYTNTNFTSSQNYIQEWKVIPSTIPTTWGEGVYVGGRSQNTGVATENAISIRWAGSGLIKAHIATGYAGVYTERDSTATLPLSKDSTYLVRATFSRTHIFVEFSRLSSVTGLPDSVGSVSCYMKYTTLATDQQQPRNTGGVWMAGLGTTGTYKVTYFHEYHYDRINAPVSFLGNSVAVRYNASNLPSHWIDMSMSGVKYEYNIMAGGGDRFQEFLLDSNYLKAINTAGTTKYLVVEGGLNGSVADYRTYGVPFFQFCQRNNYTPIWLKLFKSNDADSTFWNIVKQLNLQYIDAHNAIIAPATTDGAHLTDAGAQVVSYLIQSKLSALTGYTGGKETIVPTITLQVGATPLTGDTPSNILYVNSSHILSQSTNLNYDVTNGGLIIGTGTGQDRLTINNGSISISGFQNPASGRFLTMGAYSGGYTIIRDVTWPVATFNPIHLGNDEVVMNGAGKITINGSTANSTLSVSGSFSTAYRAITALRTLDATDQVIEVTANTFQITLPTAVGISGRYYVITNSGSGTTTLGTTSSQTFINVSGTPTSLNLAQFSTVTVVSNGANWLRTTSL